MATAKLPSLFMHSVVVAAFAVAVNLIVTSMGAFVISREVFKGREVIFTMITAGVLIPIISLWSPILRLSGCWGCMTNFWP